MKPPLLLVLAVYYLNHPFPVCRLAAVEWMFFFFKPSWPSKLTARGETERSHTWSTLCVIGELTKQTLRVIWNTDNDGLNPLPLITWLLRKWLSSGFTIRGNHYLAAGVLRTLNKTNITHCIHSFWLTATFHMAHRLLRWMLSITESDVTP